MSIGSLSSSPKSDRFLSSALSPSFHQLRGNRGVRGGGEGVGGLCLCLVLCEPFLLCDSILSLCFRFEFCDSVLGFSWPAILNLPPRDVSLNMQSRAIKSLA